MERNKILITKEDGIVEEIIDEADAGDVETYHGIISPGFINAHCHLELSHMKGMIPEKTGLVDFVYKVVNERGGSSVQYSQDELDHAISTANNEMLANGIVAVGDICNDLSTLSIKKDPEIKWYNFIEASGWLPNISQVRFERALDLYQHFSKTRSAGNSIVPHAPYSVSGELWQHISPFFKEKVVSIHNQETSFEDDLFINGSGDLVRMFQMMNIDNSHHKPSNVSSLQTYFQRLSGAASVILVHNTFTKQEDIDFVKQHSSSQTVSFCICIKANLYIENVLPPVDMLNKNNCNIVLGTDSLASNTSLDILDEMKNIQINFPEINLESMLKWATSNGSRALMMDGELGSFEKGKKPGIILIKDLAGDRLEEAKVERLV